MKNLKNFSKISISVRMSTIKLIANGQYDEVKNFLNEKSYEILSEDRIDKGFYGSSFLLKEIRTGSIAVMKIINSSLFLKESDRNISKFNINRDV